MMLHGALGSVEQLEPIGRALSMDYKVHTMNFGGHGGAAMPERFSIAYFAGQVLEYLNVNRIESVVIFGYSMGGYVGLYLARHHPERIQRVITLGTKFLWTPEIAAKEVRMLDANKIAEKVPAFARALELRHSPNDWKVVVEKTAAMMMGMGERNPLSLEDYKVIDRAVVIAVGDRDMMVGLEETIAVYKEIKKAELVVLPRMGHAIEELDLQLFSLMIDKKGDLARQ